MVRYDVRFALSERSLVCGSSDRRTVQSRSKASSHLVTTCSCTDRVNKKINVVYSLSRVADVTSFLSVVVVKQIIIIIIPRQCLWCCHHGRAIARVHPVHLMNVEWRQKRPPTQDQAS